MKANNCSSELIRKLRAGDRHAPARIIGRIETGPRMSKPSSLRFTRTQGGRRFGIYRSAGRWKILAR